MGFVMREYVTELRLFDGSLWRCTAESSLGELVRLERLSVDPEGVSLPPVVFVVPAVILRLALALHREVDD